MVSGSTASGSLSIQLLLAQPAGLLRSARILPTWWHERDHRRRPAGGPCRPGASAVRPAAHARGLGTAPPWGRLAAVAAREGLARTDRSPGCRTGGSGIVERLRLVTPLVTCSVGLAC